MGGQVCCWKGERSPKVTALGVLLSALAALNVWATPGLGHRPQQEPCEKLFWISSSLPAALQPLLPSPWLQGKAVQTGSSRQPAPLPAFPVPRLLLCLHPKAKRPCFHGEWPNWSCLNTEHVPGQQPGERLEVRHQHLPTLHAAGLVEDGGHRRQGERYRV